MSPILVRVCTFTCCSYHIDESMQVLVTRDLSPQCQILKQLTDRKQFNVGWYVTIPFVHFEINLFILIQNNASLNLKYNVNSYLVTFSEMYIRPLVTPLHFSSWINLSRHRHNSVSVSSSPYICRKWCLIIHIIFYHLCVLNLGPPSCNEGEVLSKATDYEINCNINCVFYPLTNKA